RSWATRATSARCGATGISLSRPRPPEPPALAARSPQAAAEPPLSDSLDPRAAAPAPSRLAHHPRRQLGWKPAQPAVRRWGRAVCLVRSLLAATLLAASTYCALLALRAMSRGESPLVTVAASVLLLGALVGAHRLPRRDLPLALLAGAALPALTIVERPYDPMVFGLYCLALVLAALVLNGPEIVGITAHYFLYYALFNVLIADPALAPLHWESLLAALLVFAGISMAVWSLVAGQRWLRASRTAIQA